MDSIVKFYKTGLEKIVSIKTNKYCSFLENEDFGKINVKEKESHKCLIKSFNEFDEDIAKNDTHHTELNVFCDVHIKKTPPLDCPFWKYEKISFIKEKE